MLEPAWHLDMSIGALYTFMTKSSFEEPVFQSYGLMCFCPFYSHALSLPNHGYIFANIFP